jgi:hypothetical protein
MTQLAVRVGLSSGRWLVPFVAVLLASATLVFAMTTAVGGGTSAMDQRHDVQLTQSTGEATGAVRLDQSTTLPSAASTNAVRTIAPDSCADLDGGAMHVGLDWWIVAESRNITCESGKQPLAGRR